MISAFRDGEEGAALATSEGRICQEVLDYSTEKKRDGDDDFLEGCL